METLGLGHGGCRVAVLMMAAMTGGCVSGSLASSTGPRPPGCKWSTHKRQMVHVGEKVQFDFVLQDWGGRLVPPLGNADYCVTVLEGRRIESEPDPHGHFTFSHALARLRAGEKVSVRTTAYRQHGGRDFMNIAGQWLHNDSPYEEPDRSVATASLTLQAYAASVNLRIARPPDELDPETGVLRVIRDDGTVSSVFLGKPGRPGYTLHGPEPDGNYVFHYQPAGNELNPTGKTEVRLSVHDVAGGRHEATQWVDTP